MKIRYEGSDLQKQGQPARWYPMGTVLVNSADKTRLLQGEAPRAVFVRTEARPSVTAIPAVLVLPAGCVRYDPDYPLWEVDAAMAVVGLTE